MKWKVDTSRMPSYLRVETNGDPTPDDFIAMWDEILDSSLWQPGLTVLMDNRKLKPLKDADKFTTSGVEYFGKNAQRFGTACISVVSSQPQNFKYARQFQYGTRLKGCDVVLQVFGTETQALDWLDHFCSLREARTQASA